MAGMVFPFEKSEKSSYGMERENHGIALAYPYGLPRRSCPEMWLARLAEPLTRRRIPAIQYQLEVGVPARSLSSDCCLPFPEITR